MKLRSKDKKEEKEKGKNDKALETAVEGSKPKSPVSAIKVEPPKETKTIPAQKPHSTPVPAKKSPSIPSTSSKSPSAPTPAKKPQTAIISPQKAQPKSALERWKETLEKEKELDKELLEEEEEEKSAKKVVLHKKIEDQKYVQCSNCKQQTIIIDGRCSICDFLLDKSKAPSESQKK